MTAFHTALQAFWAQFSYGGSAIKAYPSGNVPDGAVLPYITYDVVQGAYFGATIATAFVWVKATSGADAQVTRAAILDLIEQAIPTDGTAITYANGAVRLERNDAGFMAYYDDPNDTSVIGARISYEMYFYNP